MKMATPELKVVRFANDDVIATSYYIIEDPYSYTGLSGFRGAMYGSGEDGSWYVQPTGNLNPAQPDELEYIKTTGGNNSRYDWYGTPLYDAYKIGDYYYTKGASYYDLYHN